MHVTYNNNLRRLIHFTAIVSTFVEHCFFQQTFSFDTAGKRRNFIYSTKMK